MKKLITCTVICIVTSLVFSSCMSNMSITKRHYTDGYYIAHNKGKQTGLLPKEEKTIPAKKRMPLYFVQDEAQQNTTDRHSTQLALAAKAVVKTRTEHEPVAMQTRQQAPGSKEATVEKPVMHIQSGLPETTHLNNNAAAGEGLSLLWVVIVVILVLWVIGFLAGGFGLGGLINLLLLIALILLILWLLSIV